MSSIKYFILTLLLSLVIMPANASVVDTKTPIDIMVNGHYIKTDASPFIISGSTYVPIRFVSEALGADEISWDSKNNTAVIKSNNIEIVLPIGENYGYINGKYVKIGNGIKLVDDRTFVPVRFISESLGAKVAWDGNYFTVGIDKDGIDVPPSLIHDRGFTNDDIFWLGRIIESEAMGEPLEGKIAVGNVVLNRVKSADYPNTIYGVIFDDNNGVQFQPVSNGTIYNNPSYESIIAAKYSLQGEDIVGDSLYFLNIATATSSWIYDNRTYYKTVGNHSFYL